MKLKTLSLATLLVASMAVEAAPIVAPSATFAGTLIDFNFDDAYLATLPTLSITGPFDLGGGVTLSSSPNIEIGVNVLDQEDNGLWTVVGNSNRDGYFLATNFTAKRGEMGFTFDVPVQKVGIFANQYQAPSKTNNTLQVLAYDIDGNVLETFTVTIDTDRYGYDEGMFVGFERASADIYGFGIADGYFVVDNLLIAVPEAETFAMLLAGLGVLGAVARRRS